MGPVTSINYQMENPLIQLIFVFDILWESYLKFNFKQLSYSMSVKNINNIKDSALSNLINNHYYYSCSFHTESYLKFNFEKLSHSISIQKNLFWSKNSLNRIFYTDMLWESCLKFNFKQLSHSMSVKKSTILKILPLEIIIVTVIVIPVALTVSN